MPRKTLSVPTQIVAIVLLVGGLTSVLSSLMDLTSQVPQNELANTSIQESIYYLLVLIIGALSVLSGAALVKKKKWAYVLASFLVAIGLTNQILLMINFSQFSIVRFAVPILIFILLVLGRKDFKKSA